MAPAPMNQRRSDDTATWATVGGVFVIVGLLWGLGALVQGQVQRANARPAPPERVADRSAACGPGRPAPCAAVQPVSIEAPADAAPRMPVPAVYR